jgi:AAA ATPase domain
VRGIPWDVTRRPAGTAEVHVVARDGEWKCIDDFIATVGSGTRALSIRGEAGIGKTTLWRRSLDRHRAVGHRVLTTRAAEEEMHGRMVGLIDLFDGTGADSDVLDPDADLFDRGRAVLRTVRRLVEAGPLVLGIDDVQWLDPVSSRSLRYALRRLEIEPVGVVTTERSAPDAVFDGHLLGVERVERVELGPLPLAAVRQVVGTVVDSIARPVLERFYELSGGNPMYAIELARSVTAGAPLGSSTTSSLPAALSLRLAGVVSGRHDLNDLLNVAAALAPTSAGTLMQAVDRADTSGAHRRGRRSRCARRRRQPCRPFLAPAARLGRPRPDERAGPACAPCPPRRAR